MGLLATDMRTILEQREVVAAIEAALESWNDRAAVSQLRADLNAAGGPNRVCWEDIRSASALADTLEGDALGTSTPEAARITLNAATVIRVRGGKATRRGGPFEWRKTAPTLWQARGVRGTGWAVVPDGGICGIIVANWDRPDWNCSSLAEGKRIAEEIDARAKFPERLKEPEMEVVIPEGSSIRPLPDQPDVPDFALRCEGCGSEERPVAVKPVRLSPLWWDDPGAYWRCPDCNRSRGGLDKEWIDRWIKEGRFWDVPPPTPMPSRIEEL